jgi:hypothetical protein
MQLSSLREISTAVIGCKDSYDALDQTIAANESSIREMDIAIAMSYDNLDDLKEALD